MYNEKHIFIYQTILSQLTTTKPMGSIIENILIEILAIVKRYLEKTSDVDFEIKNNFEEKILSSEMIDNMIELLIVNNPTLIKLIKYMLKPHINNKIFVNKFKKTKNVQILISAIKNKIPDIFDLILILNDDEEFRRLFMYLGGFLELTLILKEHQNLNKELISRILFLIQSIYKKESFSDNIINIEAIQNLFDILLDKNSNNSFVYINILKLIASFAQLDDLKIILGSKWLDSLFNLLTQYSLQLKKIKDEKQKKDLLDAQNLILLILRIIFSLEKNKKYFKPLPNKIFTSFVDIVESQNNSSFLNTFNSLSEKELLEFSNKYKELSNNETEIGKMIGEYKIIEMIGKGGFGSVYKVKLNDKYFAMKKTKLDEKQMKFIREHPNEIDKGINEIKIWKKFNHPNIVKYYNSFIEKNDCYIIMELIEGISLGEYISHLKEKNTQINEEKIINITLDVVSVLRYMHKEVNIIYRDLNPNNIMLDNQFNVKVIDFGLAIDKNEKNEKNEKNMNNSLINQSINNTVFEGSLCYCSPEIMNNLKVNFGCDIWALGCIIYEMLKLKVPFDGDNPLAIAKNVCDFNYEKLNEDNFKNKEFCFLVKECLVSEDKRICIDDICKVLSKFLFVRMDIEREKFEVLKAENIILKKLVENFRKK
jgi:tRNA A-37 threonylcarbamoyl transferase component Bud32